MLKRYGFRLIFRMIVFVATFLVYLKDKSLLLLGDLSFRNGLQPVHILWVILMGEMILKIFPIEITSIGSRKQFKKFYRPTQQPPTEVEFATEIKQANVAARKVATLWLSGNLVIGLLYAQGFWGESEMLLITMAYYVGDLVCILFYCPFQFWFMKNRCCVTCRIFNWDCLMMVTPLLFVPSLFSWSLIIPATLVFLHWEIAYWRHPQRFFAETNQNLKCRDCLEDVCRLKQPVSERIAGILRLEGRAVNNRHHTRS
ncbi:MAG: hypothetical protein GX050_03670 [Firmicutes bacterium]|nr:hypothetical protein [Bacillota bacterium]